METQQKLGGLYGKGQRAEYIFCTESPTFLLLLFLNHQDSCIRQMQLTIGYVNVVLYTHIL